MFLMINTGYGYHLIPRGLMGAIQVPSMTLALLPLSHTLAPAPKPEAAKSPEVVCSKCGEPVKP